MCSGRECLPCFPSPSFPDSYRYSCRKMLWHSSRRPPRLSDPFIRSLLRCFFTLIQTVFIMCRPPMQKDIFCFYPLHSSRIDSIFWPLLKERTYGVMSGIIVILLRFSKMPVRAQKSGRGWGMIQKCGRCASISTARAGTPPKL